MLIDCFGGGWEMEGDGGDGGDGRVPLLQPALRWWGAGGLLASFFYCNITELSVKGAIFYKSSL